MFFFKKTKSEVQFGVCKAKDGGNASPRSPFQKFLPGVAFRSQDGSCVTPLVRRHKRKVGIVPVRRYHKEKQKQA
jgi:hypothetical protein